MTDRLYVSRNEGRSGLANIQDSIDASIRPLENYIQKSKERQITATTNDTNNTMTNRTTITREKMERKTNVWVI